MAHFKAKLTQQGFPFNFEELAGTVLIANALDQNLQGGEQLDVPQAYFMQNVLPTQRGYTGVHYSRVAAEHTYPKYIDKIFTLYDSAGNLALFSPASGARLVYSKDTAQWTSYPVPVDTIVGDTTIAYLKGTTYILTVGVGVYYYDFNTAEIVPVTLTGVNSGAIDGITAANQYLIAWDSNTVYWSSPLDPTDFTIAQGLGGSSSILSNRSRILQCLPVADGFIAYTTKSAISAPFTGNAYFPFNFKEIPNSAGVAENEHVAADIPSARHIAWTTSGFMLVQANGAQLIWPELSDAIGTGLYALADSSGYPYIAKTDRLIVKVSNIGSRYIAISVKRSAAQLSYPLAYVYDLVLERWGRLDIAHVDFFEYRAPEFVANLSYQQLAGSYDGLGGSYAQLTAAVTEKTGQFGTTFGVIAANGAVYVAIASATGNLDSLESVSSGAPQPNILLGRYRLQRPVAICLQQVGLSTAQAGLADIRFIAHDAAGNKIRSVTPAASLRYAGKYTERMTGAHVSLQLQGKLTLTSLEAEVTAAGGTFLPVRPSDTVGLYTVVVNDVPVTVSGEYVEVTP